MITSTTEPVYWSTTQKIGFRFCLLFFTLYVFFNPNGVIPYTDGLQDFYMQPFYKFIPWIAANILHLDKPIVIAITGSGDTRYDYCVLFLIFITSIIGAVVWSVINRNTPNYNKLLYWLTVVVRYYVAVTMISYGLYKVIKLQFPAPSFSRLLEPVGQLSPMGLAWTYMGYSRGFNYFTGAMEVITGTLLFFRRTSTLGALVGLIIAVNIMAINYCFDVPVKLLATMLAVMCSFLLLRDTGRLINFFFRNREALPSNLTPRRFTLQWKNNALTILKYGLLFYTICFGLIDALAKEKRRGATAKKPLLYGIYKVTTFIKNKDTLQPLTTDTFRWQRFMISKEGGAQIQWMDGSVSDYNLKSDIQKHTLIGNSESDTTHKFYLNYNLTGHIVDQYYTTDSIIFKGTWKKDSIKVWVKRMDPKSFPLLQRGFHLVSDAAYNK